MVSHIFYTIFLVLPIFAKVDWEPIDKTWSDYRKSPTRCDSKPETHDKLVEIGEKLLQNHFNSELAISKKKFRAHIEKPTDFYFSKIESKLKPLWKIIISNVEANIFKDSENLNKLEFEDGLLENLCITKWALQSSKPVYSRTDAGKFLNLVVDDLGLGMFAKPLVTTAGNKYIDDLFKKCDLNNDKSLSDEEQDCLLVDWFIPTLLKVEDDKKSEL